MSAGQGPPDAGSSELLGLLDRAIDARIDARLCAVAERLGAELSREVAERLSTQAPGPGAERRLLLTVPAAADRLSLSRSTVYELIRRGEIRSVKVGSTRRIPADALEAFRAALTGLGPMTNRRSASRTAAT